MSSNQKLKPNNWWKIQKDTLSGFWFITDLVKFSVQSPPSCVHFEAKCTQEGGDHYENFTKSVDLLQLPHGRNLKYLVKNGVLRFLGRVINPEEIE